MTYEREVKAFIKNNISSPQENSQLDQSTIDAIIDECISVDESYPMYNINVNHFNAHSRKPTNISIEFNIESAFDLLSQTGYLSGEPYLTLASVGALCSLISRKTKIDLEPETGFVYWVAYENQQDPWEIPKKDLIDLAASKSESMDVRFELTEEDVEYRIRRLCDINSFKIEYHQGTEYVILRERCSADWSL